MEGMRHCMVHVNWINKDEVTEQPEKLKRIYIEISTGIAAGL